jgi:polysaccharide export outer membrane protein
MQKITIFLFSLLLFCSCRSLKPDVMFQTKEDHAYKPDTNQLKQKNSTIGTGDRIEMRFYSIEGFKLVDVTSSTAGGGIGEPTITYLVEEDGKVKLPVIGRIDLKGMTTKDAENLLEEKYSKYYVSPFIMLRITNRHVYVFFGDGGKGVLVNLVSDNTTVIDAIAVAGGLTENSKAWRIKVVRGDLHNPQVYNIDLSTIEGMKQSELALQSNDIIYVESTPNYKQKVFAQFTPFIGILTSVLLIVNLIQK